jgi:superfamily II DNA or RNA helicase
MTAILTTEGIQINYDDARLKLTPAIFAKLIAKLTITTPQKIGKPKVACAYKIIVHKVCGGAYGGTQHIRKLYLPRSILTTIHQNKIFKFQNKLPPAPPIPNTFKGTLDANQTAIVNHLCATVYDDESANKGCGSTTLQLTAGYGKTFVGIGLIARLQTRTCVVVPANSDLSAQWLKCCAEYTTGTSIIYNAGRDVIADITIVMITTAIKKPASWFKQFGLIIYDEIHMYCSEVWSGCFWKTNVRYVLGLTATPERKDGFDVLFRKHTMGVIYAKDIPNFTLEIIDFKCIADIVRYTGDSEHTVHEVNPATGKLDSGKLVKLLNRDPTRNALIVNEVKRLYNLHNDATEIANGNSDPTKPLSIYVFCSYREHVAVLAKLLTEANLEFDAPELEFDASASAPPHTPAPTPPPTPKPASVKANTKASMKKANTKVSAKASVKKASAQATTPTTTSAHATTPTTTPAVNTPVGVMMGGMKTAIVESAKLSRITITTFKYGGTGISVVAKTAVIFTSPLRSNFDQIVARILRKGSDYDVVRRITDIVDVETALRHQYRERAKSYALYKFDFRFRDIDHSEVITPATHAIKSATEV